VAAALLQFSVDKLTISMHLADELWLVNSKTCSRLLTATYNMNYSYQIDALINVSMHD